MLSSRRRKFEELFACGLPTANGKLGKQPNEPITLLSGKIEWVDSLQYLSVTLRGSHSFGFKYASLKHSFFVACTCIYAHAKHLDEIVHQT